MDRHRAIPKGYMTVGEVAKKMGVTVRTLQYYDRVGLLAPSAESEGGRRLYSDRDLIQLHQILSMKYLGFSLDDIKNLLIPLDTPAAVAGALAEQAAAMREKIETLSQSLRTIEAFRAEVEQMQTVDFKKYADIVVNLQMKNDFYWMIKHFDDQTLDYLRGRFDRESGLAMMETFTRLQARAVQLQREGVPPESERGQDLAREYWQMVMDFTEGDMTMIPKLMEAERFAGPDGKWSGQQAAVHAFIEPALEAYFTRLGIDPFEEGAR